MNLDTLIQEHRWQDLLNTTRRQFIQSCTTGLGAFFLAGQGIAKSASGGHASNELGTVPLHHAPKAKRVIYLHMVGAPSQLELFDYKPELAKLDGQPCPQEFLEGKRFAFIQGTPNMLGPQFPFKQHGESGQWISDRFPHLAPHADELCVIRTMQTDQFNHGPAQLMVHSGDARIGRPSIGSWVTWGMGQDNQDLPGFMVLLSGGRLPRVGKALWSSGFLPSVYQGVQCRSQGDPVLNVSNPTGVSRSIRRKVLDSLNRLNQASYEVYGHPETLTRISQYEMAYRMQTAVPGVMDIADEPESILNLYGAKPGQSSFANNCLLARRLAEQDVRYIQLFDWGWDSHGASATEALHHGFPKKCEAIDQPIGALLSDLKQRGLLDDTLVVWGGEFGRTPMRENRGGTEMKLIGRDHNPEAFTIWMAGGGVKAGFSYGETDPIGYASASNPVHLRDFHATLLHLLGYDHNRLAVNFQGLKTKLTGVQPAKVISDLMA